MSITKEQFGQLKIGSKIMYYSDETSCPTCPSHPYHLVQTEICEKFIRDGVIAIEKNSKAFSLNVFSEDTIKNIEKYFSMLRDEINEKYSFWYISPEEIHSIKAEEQINFFGMSCLKCKEYNHYAVPNCRDNAFMCYGCRSWNVMKFEELKI